MLLKFTEGTGNLAIYGTDQPVSLHAESEWVDRRTGMTGGPELITIQVEGPDGRMATAWVSARVNRRGQVQFELATAKTTAGDSDEATRVNLTAKWRL
jgi:hypothetical protein